LASAFVSCATPPFAAGVARNRDAALEREQRRDVDDLAALLALDHVAADFAAELEDAGQIDRDHRVPVRVRMIGGGSAADRARVVDENVDVAERRDRLACERRSGPRLSKIRDDRRGATAGSALNRARRRVRRLRARVQDDVRARPRRAPARFAAPSPREAPVTSATLPSSLKRSGTSVS
jgi:hypothetical protein